MSVGIIAALLLALVFIAAAVAKGRNPTAVSIAASELLGRSVPAGTGILVVLLEAATAVLLAVPPTRQFGGIIAATLLIAFSSAIAQSLRSNRRPQCSCFGAFTSSPISSLDLVRNGALLVLAVLAAAA
jgi:hypothetical protein